MGAVETGAGAVGAGAVVGGEGCFGFFGFPGCPVVVVSGGFMMTMPV
jgi:hypothetical protein